MKCLWCDTETTGLEVKDSAPFEIGFILVNNQMQNGKNEKTEVEKLFYLNPLNQSILYHADAGRVHGYSEDAIRSFEPAEKVIPEIDKTLQEFFESQKQEKIFFCGYKASFDFDHLTKLFNDYGFDFKKYFQPVLIDVFEQVKKAGNLRILPYLPNRKLVTIAEFLKVPLGEDAHDALADIKATRNVAMVLQKSGVNLF